MVSQFTQIYHLSFPILWSSDAILAKMSRWVRLRIAERWQRSYCTQFYNNKKNSPRTKKYTSLEDIYSHIREKEFNRMSCYGWHTLRNVAFYVTRITETALLKNKHCPWDINYWQKRLSSKSYSSYVLQRWVLWACAKTLKYLKKD